MFALLAPKAAHAMGAVLGATPVQVRLAVAPGSDRVTHWVSISVVRPAPEVAWLIPAGRGAAVDVASSAWLEALDAVTAPRVSSTCGQSETVRSVSLADPPGPTVSIIDNRADLDAALDGSAVADETRSALQSVLSTEELVLVRAAGPDVATIRIVDRNNDSPVPLSLTRSTQDVTITAFVIANQRAALGTSAYAPGFLTWWTSGSDYAVQRDAILAGSPAGSFITESARPDAVLHAIAAGSETVPSLAHEYFSRAASLGQLAETAATCTNSALAAETSTAPVYCERAGVAGSSLAPCATSSPFACGAADDLALAVGGASVDGLWITRFAGRIVANASPPDAPLSTPGGPTVPLVRMATSAYACVPPGGGGTGGGGGGTGGTGGSTGGGGILIPPWNGDSGGDDPGTDIPVYEPPTYDCPDPNDPTSCIDEDSDGSSSDSCDPSVDDNCDPNTDTTYSCSVSRAKLGAPGSMGGPLVLALAAMLIPLRRLRRRR